MVRYDGTVVRYGGTLVRYDDRVVQLDVLSLHAGKVVEPTSKNTICHNLLWYAVQKSRQPNSHGRSDYLLGSASRL